MSGEEGRLGQMIRELLSEVAGDASARVAIERETVGHAVKTTITVWTLEKIDKPPVPEVQWCDRLVPNLRGSDTLCGQMLSADGSCKSAWRHP